MGIAAYNRGTRALSRYIDEQLRDAQVVKVQVAKPKCDHLEARCKASTRYGWNKWRWCPDCRTYFWFGDRSAR